MIVVLVAAPARAQTPEQCIDSHEAGQRMRKDGKLRAARRELESCTHPGCPAPVQEDCARWREELDAALPTVVAIVRDGGRVQRAATMRVDGEVLQQTLDGRAVAVDPGERLFRFETADGRVVEKRLVILEGVKNRVIEVRFPPLAEHEAPPSPPGGGAPPAAFWITGAVGIAGVSAFAIVGGIGLSKENSLRDECAGACPEDEVDTVRRLYVAADIAGAVGIAALLTATVIGIVDLMAEEKASTGWGPDGFRLRF